MIFSSFILVFISAFILHPSAFILARSSFILHPSSLFFRHGVHPDPLPADPEVWASCCSEQDCMEAPVSVSKIDAEQTLVVIADFPGFRVRSDIVRPSQNGRSYFCTRMAEIPPTPGNTLCVFYSRPSYVRREGRKKDLGG